MFIIRNVEKFSGLFRSLTSLTFKMFLFSGFKLIKKKIENFVKKTH